MINTLTRMSGNKQENRSLGEGHRHPKRKLKEILLGANQESTLFTTRYRKYIFREQAKTRRTQDDAIMQGLTKRHHNRCYSTEIHENADPTGRFSQKQVNMEEQHPELAAKRYGSWSLASTSITAKNWRVRKPRVKRPGPIQPQAWPSAPARWYASLRAG
jgi:hypothetical protein